MSLKCEIAIVTAIDRLGDFACACATVGYAFIASDGSLIIPENTPVKRIYDLLNLMVGAMRASNQTADLRYRGKSFRITLDMVTEGMNLLLPCFYDTPYVEPSDGDVLKHSIGHVKVILL